ncbi:uncharacterized protein JCM10292_006099 [Rhodotorula paludigena]|uniref:uncharacterized protein n=1 Tax=Rhodotorula paludigena TaxID=86838 RepID=UPI00317BDBCD
MAVPARALARAEHRLQLARELLRRSAHAPQPIAALVCLLDALVCLAHYSASSTALSHADSQAAQDSQERAQEHSALSSTEAQQAPTPDPNAHSLSSATTDEDGARTVDQAGAQGTEQPAPRRQDADWASWAQCFHLLFLASASDADRPSTAPALLPLPPAARNAFAPLPSLPSFDDKARSSLTAGCNALLAFLEVNTADQQPATVDMLMTEIRSPTFPPHLPSSTTSSIAASLVASSRTAKLDQKVAQKTLATLLGHYVSPSAFGERTSGDSTRLAAVPEDETLLCNVFTPQPTTAAPTMEDEDDDDEADTRSIATGIRDAQASIARKDDKLRWLLGDNFRKGPQAGSSAAAALGVANASVTPPRRSLHATHPPVGGEQARVSLAREREDSAGTVDSHATARTDASDASGHHSAGKRHHHRFTSTSSSVAPLLDSFGRGERAHRRAASSLSTAALPGLPPLAQAVDVPTALQRDSSDAAAKPFADLAPALHTPSSSTSPTTSRRADSPRRISLDSALDCNTLSAAQRRELVRRSKKLEGFFGATFQESAAAKVLVDRRGGQQHQQHQQHQPPAEVSPTNASFPPSSGAPNASSTHTSPDPSTRRASLAPPGGPMAGYTFGTASSSAASPSRTDGRRRPSLLSLDSRASSQCALSAPSSARGSTGSLTPGGPTSPSGGAGVSAPRMRRSSSSPSRGRRSSSFSSLAEPSHVYFSTRAQRRRSSEEQHEAETRERDERRRKLEKVRRVLGERVPAGLVVVSAEAAETPAMMMGRSRGKGGVVGGRFRDKLKRGAPGAKDGASRAALRPPGGDRGWQYVEPQWLDEGGHDGGEARKGTQQLEALHRARKLENLFGDLPPPSLFLSHASSVASSPTPPARPSYTWRHRRSQSDLSGLSHSPFSPQAVAGSWSPPAAPTPDSSELRRERTRSTINSYRQSLASLTYVMERDPGALDEVVRVYSQLGHGGESSDEDDEDGDAADAAERLSLANVAGNEEDEDAERRAEATGMQRSASASSHRAVRQAQKLSNFFGTTRGEVWRMLLNDIEASIVDDESLDDEERAEVLSGLERLRQSANARV